MKNERTATSTGFVRAVNVSRIAAIVIGPLVAFGEIFRRWDEFSFFPKAFDDIIAALFLIAGAALVRKDNARLLTAAWAFFAGMSLVALVTNLDYILRGSDQSNYLLLYVLSFMFLVGLALMSWLMIASQPIDASK
jgi:hypothetical protein